MALYSLREANRSVQLSVALFLLLLGYSYIFAFLMVKQNTGLTPKEVAATYLPKPTIEESQLPQKSQVTEQRMDMGQMMQMMTESNRMKHTVDTQLLIQDSHIHIMIYALVGAFEALIILGLEWSRAWRDTMIAGAFGFGALDFAGQWLMKAGIGGFSWLTITSGWGMATVYLIVLYGTFRAVWLSRKQRSMA